MKELSIEEKAKRYDEAIKRAKEQLNGAKAFDYDNEQIAHNIRTTVYNIYPELKESEDEQIRKRIIQSLHGDVLDMKETNKTIAWLENVEVAFEQQQEQTSDHWQDLRERAAVAHLVPPQHYSTLLEWEDEATDPECKDILHHYAWRAFHIETM